MSAPSSSHLVAHPALQHRRKTHRRVWRPVWVVVDSSTDGTLEALQALARDDPNIRVLSLPRNQGKGAAMLHGLREAGA